MAAEAFGCVLTFRTTLIDKIGTVNQFRFTMKTATVRELRTEFPRLEALLFGGETIAITKRKRIVAKLVPVDTPERPDFRRRFGGAVPPGGRREDSAVELLSEDRGK